MDYIFNEKYGYFFHLTERGYRACELYLPCAPGTYGEPIETTKERWLKDLNETGGYIRRKKPLGGSLLQFVKYSLSTRHFYDWHNGELTDKRFIPPIDAPDALEAV